MRVDGFVIQKSGFPVHSMLSNIHNSTIIERFFYVHDGVDWI